MYAMMEEQFYGDSEKRIKGACKQLIDGDNAFGFLYNVNEGENGPKRTLKSFCCGSSTSSNYVAGVHFTVEMIGLKSKKRLPGRSLWRAGQDVLRLIKKAMALVLQLDGKVVNLGKNHHVLGYASGKNYASFIQFIDNGMYALGLKEGKGAIVDRDDSDGDNNVIGQVVRNTADSMPYCLGDVDDDDKERGDDDVQEVVKHSLNYWNPFNSVDAPKGYSFFGKLSFICLGPASEYYSETLSSKGSQATSVEDKKLMG